VPALAALSWVYWRVLVRGEVFGSGDHSLFYWPVKSVYAALARSAGGVPLWNPFVASGQPFAANPEHAVFHPLTTLFLVLPFEWAYRLQVLVPVLLLALSGYFLGRTLHLPRSVSAASAVVWGMGGATVSLVQVLPTLFTFAPLPAAIAFAVHVGRRRLASDVLSFALLYGLMVLGGDPPSLLMGTLLCAVATLHGARLGAPGSAPRASPAGGLARLAAGGLLGAAIGAATLVPGLVHASRTVRAAGLDAETALSFTTPAVRLAEAAIPGAVRYGSLQGAAVPLGERLYPARGAPFLSSIYPGLLVIVSSVAAWAPRGSPARLWALPAALGLVLSLGAATPVFPALRALPLFSGLRFPERFLLLTLVSLAVAGTCGLASLLKEGPERLLRASAVGLLALLAAAAVLVGGNAASGSVLLPALARQGGALGVSLVAVAVAARARPGSLLRLTPAFALAADLGVAARPLVHSRRPSELRALPAPLLPLATAPPRGYVFHAAAQDRSRFRVEDLASPPYLAQFGVASALDRDFDLTELVWSTRATAAVLRAIAGSPARADAILARRGVAAVVAFRPDAPQDLSAAAARSPSDLLTLLAVPRPQPLAFAADALVSARGVSGWRDAVASAGAAARSLAVVDPADVPWSVPPRVSAARVGVVSRRATRLVLRVEAEGPEPCFVALNQTWDPGWEAHRDGERVPLVRTDLSLSGLLLPPGRHDVVLSYRSVPVLAGAVVSLVALLATGISYRIARRRAVS
jgi:hypothetical protein